MVSRFQHGPAPQRLLIITSTTTFPSPGFTLSKPSLLQDLNLLVYLNVIPLSFNFFLYFLEVGTFNGHFSQTFSYPQSDPSLSCFTYADMCWALQGTQPKSSRLTTDDSLSLEATTPSSRSASYHDHEQESQPLPLYYQHQFLPWQQT